MGTKALGVITVLLGVGLWLAWTNPTSQDYEKYQDKLIAQGIEQLGSGGGSNEKAVLKRLAESRSGLLFKALIRNQTKRRNLGLCSLFDTKLFGARIVVLGIGGTFVPLTDVEEAFREAEKGVLGPNR